jgi:flagellar biosynthesis protein FlhF
MTSTSLHAHTSQRHDESSTTMARVLKSTSGMDQQQSFYGRTSREALAAVKRTLGDDAVIIATRERRDDPARRFEIEAARGEVSTTSSSPVAPALPAAARYITPPSTPPTTRATRATPEPAANVSTSSSSASMASLMSSTMSALLPPRGAGALDHRVLENLERAGLDALVRARLLDRCRRLQLSGSEPVEALRKTIDELASATLAPWQTTVGQRRLVGFVGPTGAGKTTTIAKVAAQALLHRRRVALITTDTWRVGATQHLARYGEIMGLPTYVAENEDELLDAVDHARAADLVLIDSAGRSPRSLRDGVQLHVVKGIEVHLVVPVTASAAQLGTWRTRHRSDDPSALIATKLDEAEGLQEVGGVLNSAAILGLPLAATADGQTVPDDIAPFDSATLWRRLGGQR